MSYFLTTALPKDLPESWTSDQYVSPSGTDVGLTEKHGYNYLNRQVNNSQAAIMELAKVACSGYQNLLDNWYFLNPMNTANGYCALKGTTYYSDASVTTSAGTLSTPTDVRYVNSTYGVVTISGTQYYVKTSAMYQGYARETGSGTFTFDRWWAKACTVTLDKSGKGINLQCTNGYNTGTFRQPVMNAIALSGRQVTMSVYVESITGTATLKMYTGATADALSTVSVGSGPALKQGVNSATFSVSTIGSGKAAYLFAVVELSLGASVTIQAIKLQPGPAHTLGYSQDNGYWRLTEVPNYVVDYLRCIGAPVDMGGQGSISIPSTTLLADASVE